MIPQMVPTKMIFKATKAQKRERVEYKSVRIEGSMGPKGWVKIL